MIQVSLVFIALLFSTMVQAEESLHHSVKIGATLALSGKLAFIGEAERVDIGVRIRHLSNGGTEDINWGINHLMLRTAIRF